MNRFLFFPVFLVNTIFCFGQGVADHFVVIRDQGLTPIDFVQKKLKDHDLIIFDDALHSAYEPFEFYIELLETPGNPIDYVFIEVFGINAQPFLDAYFASETEDRSLLLKVFQDDYAGLGWRYETYYNLLSAIWYINHREPADSKKILVVAIDQPIFWDGLHSREDYDIFQRSLGARDYFMYRIILDQMSGFKKNKKGVFLTNTRHAYKDIKNTEGLPYWNCGTFFYTWNPGKTYSIRIHNVTLSISTKKENVKNASIQGLDAVEFKWIKMDEGAWDKAFQMNGNVPVAIPLKDNVFGRTSYVGNHMLNAMEGQTMFDAYDALIFLAALEDLHFSPKIDFIYTDPYKKEMKRRLEVMHGGELQAFLDSNGAKSAEEYIDKISQYAPKSQNTLHSLAD